MKTNYDAILNSIPLNAVIFEATNDGDFKIIDLNEVAQKTEKVTKESVIGSKVTKTFPAIIEFGLFDIFKRVCSTGKQEVHDISFYQDDRISGWRKNTVSLLESGIIISVYEDVTSKKQLEEEFKKSQDELKELNSSLKEQVTEKTSNPGV